MRAFAQVKLDSSLIAAWDGLANCEYSSTNLSLPAVYAIRLRQRIGMMTCMYGARYACRHVEAKGPERSQEHNAGRS